jgi:insertion element IS1 protein InsB
MMLIFIPTNWKPIEKLFLKSCIIPVKKSGKTSLIERLNCTLRQRVSRLVRKSLSFSKKLSNYVGAIKYFLSHYNLEAFYKFLDKKS